MYEKLIVCLFSFNSFYTFVVLCSVTGKVRQKTDFHVVFGMTLIFRIMKLRESEQKEVLASSD